MTPAKPFFARKLSNWQDRLVHIVATMREMSRQTDPLAMGRAYSNRMRELLPTDRLVTLSRRNLERPFYRITRSSLWQEVIDPWREPHRLPLLSAGLLGELLYGDEPRVLDEIAVVPDDPAAEYFAGMRSLVAIPNYDKGEGLNMVVMMRAEPAGFDREEFPELVWMSNLYGRATHNLVLSSQLQEAYEAADRELRIVADIQRSLLPAVLPSIPTMALAAHYQTSKRAGGDYYDLFELPGGRWGILIADVSGHGTPAAVLMAILHGLAHTYPGEPTRPGELLSHLNRHLTARYTRETGTFVTAFYAVYDPATRLLTYASAGHPPPRLKRCADGSLASLNGVQGLPLGIVGDEDYAESGHALRPGDQLIFFTDGITEAEDPAGRAFGLEQLDRVLADCAVGASDLLQSVLGAVETFTAGRPAADDRTVLVAKIS